MSDKPDKKVINRLVTKILRSGREPEPSSKLPLCPGCGEDSLYEDEDLVLDIPVKGTFTTVPVKVKALICPECEFEGFSEASSADIMKAKAGKPYGVVTKDGEGNMKVVVYH